MKIINYETGYELIISNDYAKTISFLSEKIEFFKDVFYYPYTAASTTSSILHVIQRIIEINSLNEEAIDYLISFAPSPFVKEACTDMIHYKYMCYRLVRLLEKFVKEGK